MRMEVNSLPAFLPIHLSFEPMERNIKFGCLGGGFGLRMMKRCGDRNRHLNHSLSELPMIFLVNRNCSDSLQQKPRGKLGIIDSMLTKKQRYIRFGNRNIRSHIADRACVNQTRLEQSGIKTTKDTPLGVVWLAPKDWEVSSRRLNARQKRRFKYWGFLAAKHSDLS